MLSVAGAVARPGVWDFAALATLDGQVADVGALAPGRVGGAVAVRALLAAAGIAAGATALHLTSRDGAFTADVPLAALAYALLIYRLGDAPLPERFGGPVRFLIPDATACGLEGIDACANVKDVGALEVR